MRAEWIDFAIRQIKSYDERAPYVLYASLAFNLLYAVFKLAVGIGYQSFWMIGLGAYYGLLAVMRFLLMRQIKKDDPASALKAYRRTAWLLLGLTVVMSGIIGQTFIGRETYEYPGILIYAFAAFAFGKVISATVSLIRKRKHESHVLAAARCVTFAQALMSVLALQVALINRFGAENNDFARIMNGSFGGVICLLVIITAVGMLIRSQTKKEGNAE